MDRLDDLEAFLAIVERGSQVAAARRLGRSLQSVNRSLAALERSVGVELIRRTTRRSIPTEAGLAFYRRVQPAFAEIGDARLEAARSREEPSGLLRVGAPVLFAPAWVAPVACDFMARYGHVEVELKVSDRPADLIADGLDVAIRIRELPDSALHARKLGELRVVVFGAPAYFDQRGRPGRPEELAEHECVLRISEQGADVWPFRIDGKRRTVRVNGRFRTDSAAASHAAVARGFGIGIAPLWQIRDLADAGAVEVILADFEAPGIPIHAVWPATKLSPAKTRLFVDLLAASLKRERL